MLARGNLFGVFGAIKVLVGSSSTFLDASAGDDAWTTWLQVSHLMTYPLTGICWLT